MRDYMDIGSGPANESCAQLGQEGYAQQARAECNRFIELIRKTLGEEPEGASLAIKNNRHDFGSYMSVVCYYEDDMEEARRYAYRCEGDAPTEWEDDSSENAAESGNSTTETVTELGKPAPETEFLGLPIFAGSTETKANSGMMTCDFCSEEVNPVVDGRTKEGPWAAMCPDHFKEHGVGLGTGYGQKLVSPEAPQTPSPMTVGAVLKSKRRPTTYCESCREAADEAGAPDDDESIGLVLGEMGLDIADHLCDDDETGGCLCACGKRFRAPSYE